MSDYRHKKGYSSSSGRRSPYDDKHRNRSRSRSPIEQKRRNSSPIASSKSKQLDNDDNLPPAPPPPLISKAPVVIPKFKPPKIGIQMKLSGPPKKEAPKPVKVASVFGNDSDDEPEEMPAECKMRMRNIGRDTPTSSGPNSYGKTKQGFCDSKKIFEKQLKQLATD